MADKRSDREFVRLMITHRGYVIPRSLATFVKFYPKLEDMAKDVAKIAK
jgi:hypothetical protein